MSSYIPLKLLFFFHIMLFKETRLISLSYWFCIALEKMFSDILPFSNTYLLSECDSALFLLAFNFRKVLCSQKGQRRVSN